MAGAAGWGPTATAAGEGAGASVSAGALDVFSATGRGVTSLAGKRSSAAGSGAPERDGAAGTGRARRRALLTTQSLAQPGSFLSSHSRIAARNACVRRAGLL